MELEVTWTRAMRIWWSYLWRNLLAVIAAMFVGAILGFILGISMSLLGISPSTMKIIGIAIGAVVGLAMSIVPVKMILGKDFGEFRLVLLAEDQLVPPELVGGIEVPNPTSDDSFGTGTSPAEEPRHL